MTGLDPFEARLERTLLELSAPAAVPARPDQVTAALATRRQAEGRSLRRRGALRPWRTRSVVTSTYGVAAVIAVLVFGSLVFILPNQLGTRGPRPTAPGQALDTPSSSASSSASTSPTPTPILWTQASLDEDWPAPVRAEPAGGAAVVSITVEVDPRGGYVDGIHIDPTGDNGSDLLPWADITKLTVSRAVVGFDRASNAMPRAAPTEQWIAFGVVADTDRDGAPDWRYGMDNVPAEATGEDAWPHRAWRTDLHTGRTAVAGNSGMLPDNTVFYGEPGVLKFGGGLAGGGTFGGLPERFYVWVAVIQDGRVVATDYAPDLGWLEVSIDATP
jgi:hypothetical protein